MLMVHRITEISETGGEFDKGYIRAEYDVSPDDWYFPCHFQGNPIMHGCLGLDGMWQLTGFSSAGSVSRAAVWPRPLVK